MKRLLALVAAMMLFTTAFAESYPAYISESEGESFTLLLDADGEILTPEYEYGMIYRLNEADAEGALFCAVKIDENGEVSACYLMNERGEILLDRGFQSLECRRHTVLATEFDGKMTAMDEAGSVLLKGDYGWIEPNGEDGYLALKVDETFDMDADEAYPVVAISAQGEETATGVIGNYWLHGWYSDGLCRVTDFSHTDDGETLYLDSEGKLKFTLSGYADDFTGGYLIVYDDKNRNRLLDTNGTDVLGGAYASISFDASEGENAKFIVADERGGVSVLNAQTLECETTIPPCGTKVWSTSQEQGGLIMVWYDDRSRIYDQTGKLLFENMDYLQTEVSIPYMSQGDGSVIRFIRSSGVWPDLAQTLLDSEGNACGEEHRYIDGMGSLNGKARYLVTDYEIDRSDDDASVIDATMRYGVCDENGEMVISAEYDWIEMLTWDRYWVQKGDRWGMLDESENWLAEVNLAETDGERAENAAIGE